MGIGRKKEPPGTAHGDPVVNTDVNTMEIEDLNKEIKNVQQKDKHVQFDVKEDQYNGSGLGILGSDVPGVINTNDDEEMKEEDEITVHENGQVTTFQDSVRWTSVAFKFKMPIDAESRLLTDPQEFETDEEKKPRRHHPGLAGLIKVIKGVDDQNSALQFRTTKSNEILDLGMLQQPISNTGFKKKFNYNLTRFNGHTNLTVALWMDMSEYKNLYHAKESIWPALSVKDDQIYIDLFGDPRDTARTTQTGFLINRHPHFEHITTIQSELNVALQAQYQQESEKYKRECNRKNVPYPPPNLPSVHVRKMVVHLFHHNSKQPEKSEGLTIHVPTQFRLAFNSILGDLQKQDEQWERCDKSWLRMNLAMKETYYKQVGHFSDYMRSYKTGLLFGFTSSEMEQYIDQFTNIRNVESITKTNQTQQRGQYKVLMNKQITTQELDQIDDLCEELNQFQPCQYENQSKRCRSREVEEQLSSSTRESMTSRWKERPLTFRPAPSPMTSPWGNPTKTSAAVGFNLPHMVTALDASVATAVTTPDDHDFLQSKVVQELKADNVEMRKKMEEQEKRVALLEKKTAATRVLCAQTRADINASEVAMESKIEEIEYSFKGEINVVRERITATRTRVEELNLSIQETSVSKKLLITTTAEKADQRAANSDSDMKELKAMMMQFMSSCSERPTSGGIIGDHNSNNSVTNNILATKSGSTETIDAFIPTVTEEARNGSSSTKKKRSESSLSMPTHDQSHRVSDDSAHNTDDPKIGMTRSSSSPIRKKQCKNDQRDDQIMHDIALKGKQLFPAILPVSQSQSPQTETTTQTAPNRDHVDTHRQDTI